MPPSEKDRTIGRYIADLIEDGSTIQLGIGGIPNAVAAELMSKKDLGIHTEMLTDTMVDLAKAGVVTGKRKTLMPGKIVATFAMGTQKLYDFINDNPAVMMCNGSWVNDPAVIAQNYRQVSINTTMEVDLTGQCCSESVSYTHLSKDEPLRENALLEDMAKLRPAFKKDGIVTAGNSSPMSDGAGAVVVMEKNKAKEMGLEIMATFKGYTSVGVDPNIMGYGPVPAIRKLLKQTGVSLDEVDLIELNEAFAAQSIPCIRDLGLDMDKVNVNGGAIALGRCV